MAYNTYSYLLLFFGISFLLYTVTPKKFKWITLLISSYAYYIFASQKWMEFLIITTISIYVSGILLQKVNDDYETKKSFLNKDEKKQLKQKTIKKKKWIIAITVFINLAILFALKYLALINVFFSVAKINLTVPVFNRFLPIGISFYSLQAISYVVDVYRGKIKADKNLGRVALFLSFFPQALEGPIGRYDRLAPQLYEGHSFDFKRVSFGMQLILWGLIKKVVIADRADILVKEVFTNYQNYSGVIVISAVLFYTLQIYCEFSGCMDIVLGGAQVFGITLDKNFNQPFFSKSVSEFWRRWHITLGTWMKDYVFYPISLSKAFAKITKKAKKVFNGYFGMIVPTIFALFFVWFLTGFWHGASYKYILYGLYYYVIMSIGMICEPLFKKVKGNLKIDVKSKGYISFQIFRTFLLVNIGMLIFRADTFKIASKMFLSMFKNVSFGVITNGTMLNLGIDKFDFIVLAVGFIAVLIVGIIKEKGFQIREWISQKTLPIRWSIYMTAIFTLIIFGAYGFNYDAVAFIYAQF